MPKLGTASDGQPCLTTRDWSLVDQEQSDNVNTEYIILENGKTGQNSEANRKALNEQGILFKVLKSGFDNRLVPIMDAALGCSTFEAPSLHDIGNTVPSLALNELFGNANQPQPQALVPDINPLTVRFGQSALTLELLDGYRAGVFQPSVSESGTSGVDYCNNMDKFAPARYLSMQPIIDKVPSPDLKAADTLLNFLCSRFEKTFSDSQPSGLECNILTKKETRVFGLKNATGQAIACTIDGVTFPSELADAAKADIKSKRAKFSAAKSISGGNVDKATILLVNENAAIKVSADKVAAKDKAAAVAAENNVVVPASADANKNASPEKNAAALNEKNEQRTVNEEDQLIAADVGKVVGDGDKEEDKLIALANLEQVDDENESIAAADVGDNGGDKQEGLDNQSGKPCEDNDNLKNVRRSVVVPYPRRF
jgi:hypothetical protein